MSIEQTAQLIQLILNSMLMIVGCALVSNRLERRHSVLIDRLQNLMGRYAELLESDPGQSGLALAADPQIALAKKQLRQLQNRYTLTSASLLAVHAALLLAVGNVLLLALRSLVDLDWLIPLSLTVFVAGVASLLLGAGLTLLDLQTVDRALWQEMQDLLSWGHSKEIVQSNPRVRSSRSRTRRTVREKPPLRAKVG